MPAMHAGEIWKLQVDDGFRRVKVIGAAGIAGWWRCVDLATDISFLARQHWFVERQEKAGAFLSPRASPHCAPAPGTVRQSAAH